MCGALNIVQVHKTQINIYILISCASLNETKNLECRVGLIELKKLSGTQKMIQFNRNFRWFIKFTSYFYPL